MPHTAPIELVVYYPKTAAGKGELARCVGEVHADMVDHKLHHMHIPAPQKLRLLDAVADTVRQLQKPRTH